MLTCFPFLLFAVDAGWQKDGKHPGQAPAPTSTVQLGRAAAAKDIHLRWRQTEREHFQKQRRGLLRAANAIAEQTDGRPTVHAEGKGG